MAEHVKKESKDSDKSKVKNAGKGIRPIIGYNYRKYWSNYDRIFRNKKKV